jgi:hypothetical protein
MGVESIMLSLDDLAIIQGSIYNTGMLEESNGSSGDNLSFHALLYQWSARVSVIALEMVLPAVMGIGLDRLLGTVAFCAILGTLLGMALGFGQLLKIANFDNGIDNPPDTRDNRVK